jgi:hydroxymethylpyrimidine/phosphomethylpyrimidine kinase
VRRIRKITRTGKRFALSTASRRVREFTIAPLETRYFRGVMASPKTPTCALSIAGLDPGGGAGLLADMRGFAAAGAFGCAVAAVLTVQSTSGLRDSKAVLSKLVVAQATEIMRHQRVRAIKVGALGSAANARACSKSAP